jgi:hypothetical protein
MKDFRDLVVWQKAQSLTLSFCRATDGFPKAETYGLTIQIHRCSTSIAATLGRVQNFVTSVKLKSFTFMAGTTMSKDSSPLARTGVPMVSTLDSI